MSFPQKNYSDAGLYTAAYRDEIIRAWQELDGHSINKAAEILSGVIHEGNTIFACGNGGSAAIANHLLCDFLKGVQTDTGLLPKIISLSSHLELITAIANDISYDDIFSYQLRTMARPGDLLITISSSGNSENVVRAISWCRGNQVSSVALTGFDGGRSATLADVNLHVTAANYGVIEDVHQSLMHCLAQYLRQSAMPQSLIPVRQF